MNPDVDFYFEKKNPWQEAIGHLRAIALSANLSEALKWGCPCYTLGKSNVVLIHTFKEYCAFLFFKGALMDDPKKMLIQQTENVQAARQIRFSSAKEVIRQEPLLKKYIAEAIRVEKAGLKVELKKTREFAMPDEFKSQLDKNPVLKTAFEALTPGRQRAYLLHFSSAKQAATREARIAKCTPAILQGKGLLD